MGFINFETKNAIYRVELIGHPKGEEFTKDVLRDADAFVLEFSRRHVDQGVSARGIEARDFIGSTPDLFTRFREVTNISRERGTPIFFPDVNPLYPTKSQLINEIVEKRTDYIREGLSLLVGLSAALELRQAIKQRKKMSRRDAIRTIGSISAKTGFSLGNWLSFLLLKFPGEISLREPFRQYTAFWDKLIARALVEGRNAVAAEKMERFIAPLLRERLGRKPVIYTAWGVSHAGIKEAIEDAEYREAVLKQFSPPEKYFSPENLSDCIEVSIPRMIRAPKKIKVHRDVITFPKPTAKDLKESRERLSAIERELKERKIGREAVIKETEKHVQEERMSRRGFFAKLRQRRA